MRPTVSWAFTPDSATVGEVNHCSCFYLPMALNEFHLSTDYAQLTHQLTTAADFLIIQDLDGVCMSLVADPLTRTLDPSYLAATQALDQHFFVLTNGEHIGPRGINAIIERQLEEEVHTDRCYLPGLAAGGVQWQDRFGAVSHPGVSDAEMAFLGRLPQRFSAFLHNALGQCDATLSAAAVAQCVNSAVLDNPVSPTLNLNAAYALLQARPTSYVELQQQTEAFTRQLLAEARQQGLGDSFFLHLAPNRGHHEGLEQLAPGSAESAGTTDFQIMLSGAIKEAGVLFLLNHAVYQRHGRYPLGADFTVRSAPANLDALVTLAAEAFRDTPLPTLVGVGDTITSHHDVTCDQYQRGGSDRGFLTLIQQLSHQLGNDHAVVFVDSSGGEVRRPGLPQPLPTGSNPVDLPGISDIHDPLELNFVFPSGHTGYIEWFQQLASACRR